MSDVNKFKYVSTCYLIQLYLLKRWTYYRCLIKELFWKPTSFRHWCFSINYWIFQNVYFKNHPGTAAFVLSLLSVSVNLFSYNKQIFHVYLFNVTNFSPEVINNFDIKQKRPGIFVLLYATNTRQNLKR